MESVESITPSAFSSYRRSAWNPFAGGLTYAVGVAFPNNSVPSSILWLPLRSSARKAVVRSPRFVQPIVRGLPCAFISNATGSSNPASLQGPSDNLIRSGSAQPVSRPHFESGSPLPPPPSSYSKYAVSDMSGSLTVTETSDEYDVTAPAHITKCQPAVGYAVRFTVLPHGPSPPAPDRETDPPESAYTFKRHVGGGGGVTQAVSFCSVPSLSPPPTEVYCAYRLAL